MSEMERHKGKLIPTGKTLEEYSDNHDLYSDEHYEKIIIIDGKVFTIDKVELNPYDSVFDSRKNDDGTIDFDVMYYSGGCPFNEAIELALKEE